MTEYEVHPAADLFPMMSDAEIEVLGEDMLEHGQREPIILFHGQILDGRNRYRACLLKGIAPRFHEERPADPVAYVISKNLKRRHLDESQRAMVAATLATLQQGQRHDRVEGSIDLSTAAQMLNVSEPSIKRAKTVQREAVPEIVYAVEQGEVSVSSAAEFAKQPKEDQKKQIAEAGTAAAAVKASAAVKRAADRAEQAAAAKTAKSRKRKLSPAKRELADRLAKAADAKAATEVSKKVADIIGQFEEIDLGPVARMTDEERIELMVQLARANVWINKTALDIAIVGGANLDKLAPPSLRYDALSFMREAIARIETELSGRDVPESTDLIDEDRADVAPMHANSDDGDRRRWDDDDPRWLEVRS